MANKMTIAEQYDAIIAKAKAKDALSAEEIAFLEDRKAKHLAKNANKKMTKAQVENEEIKKNILESMNENQFYTATEIQKLVGLESFNKASALVTQLKDAGLVIRSTNKSRAYFTKA